MNICDNASPSNPTNPEPIPGHIYKCDEITTDFGQLAIAVDMSDGSIRLVSLKRGAFWSSRSTFGRNFYWYDVTEQYCLTKLNKETK